MGHEVRREVHLLRLYLLDPVRVEEPLRKHEARHLDGRHPVHLAAKVAVNVAHARRHVAAGQGVEVRFSLRQYPPKLLVAALATSLLLALERIAVEEAQPLHAVPAVLDALRIAELASAVAEDQAEGLGEPGPAELLEGVERLDHAGRRLVR